MKLLTRSYRERFYLKTKSDSWDQFHVLQTQVRTFRQTKFQVEPSERGIPPTTPPVTPDRGPAIAASFRIKKLPRLITEI